MLRYLLFLFLLLNLTRSMAQQTVDVVVQTGHGADVNSVAFSPDGKYIASACYDGNVKIWDAKLGFEIFKLGGFEKWATSICFTADGKYLIGTGGKLNIVWDVTTSKKIARISLADSDETESEAVAVVPSHNNQYVFSAREDFTVMRWQTDELANINKYSNGAQVPIDDDSSMNLMPPFTATFFKGHTSYINALALSNDDKILVTSSADNTIIVWDAETGNQLKSIKTNSPVISIAISTDGKYIIGCNDETSTSNIYTWELLTGKQVSKITDGYNHYRSIAISNNGKYLAAAMLSKEIILYALPSFKILSRIKGHTGWVHSVAFSNDNKYIASSASDNTIKIWDVASATMVKDLRKTTVDIDKLCYEKGHRLLTAASRFGNKELLTTWDIEHDVGLKNILYTKPQSSMDLTLMTNDDGKKLLVTEDSALIVYDPLAVNTLKKITIPNMGIASFLKDANAVIFQNKKDYALYTIGINKAEQPLLFANYPEKKHVYTIDCSLDGKMIATGEIGASIHIWDAHTKRHIKTFNYVDVDSSRRSDGSYSETDMDVSNAWVTSIKFSPNGKLLAAACRQADPLVKWGVIIVWEVATGKLLYWKNAHEFQIQSINWSADGRRIITGSNDKMVKVWDTASFLKEHNEPLLVYSHDFTAMHTSFTQDDKWIISAGIDGKIIIKDADSYEDIAQLIGIDSSDYIAITKDQYYAASKNATRQIAFRQGNKVFPVEQFDLKFNRPDKVMEALGSKDSVLIKAYKSAYEKRLKRRGFTEEMLSADLHLPQLNLLNQNSIPLSTNQSKLDIAFDISDDKYALNSYTVLVNGVPLTGEKNNVSSNKKSIKTSIPLNVGSNKIQLSCLNEKGAESLKETFITTYNPATKPIAKTWFIGIGVSKYADASRNLTYADKDIRDLSALFKSKYTDCKIDTLLNEKVTKENILAIKEKLKQTGIEDRVIIAISGHGLVNNKLDFYFATHNINFDNPEQNGILFEDLESLLNDIPARKKLMLIDACHSGELDKNADTTKKETLGSKVKEVNTKAVSLKSKPTVGLQNSFEIMKQLFTDVSSSGSVIISAAGGKEFAFEDGKLNNGVFTYCIKQAITNNKADIDKNGLSVSELKIYVSKMVEELTKGRQKPTSRSENVDYDWMF